MAEGVGEGGRRCSGAGGGNDGGLGLTEEPLDGLAIGLVSELTCELEHTCGADDRHPDASASSVDLAVPVLGRWLLDGEGAASAARRRRRHGLQLQLLLMMPFRIRFHR